MPRATGAAPNPLNSRPNQNPTPPVEPTQAEKPEVQKEDNRTDSAAKKPDVTKQAKTAKTESNESDSKGTE